MFLLCSQLNQSETDEKGVDLALPAARALGAMRPKPMVFARSGDDR